MVLKEDNHFKPKRGRKSTAENKNIVLEKGEVFFEYPEAGTGASPGKIKMGDGKTEYSELPYFIQTAQTISTSVTLNTWRTAKPEDNLPDGYKYYSEIIMFDLPEDSIIFAKSSDKSHSISNYCDIKLYKREGDKLIFISKEVPPTTPMMPTLGVDFELLMVIFDGVNIEDSLEILDTSQSIISNTSTGKVSGALVVKELLLEVEELSKQVELLREELNKANKEIESLKESDRIKLELVDSTLNITKL